MSKVEFNKAGKADKHRGNATYQALVVRSKRVARVKSSLDIFLLDRICRGSSDEPDGALAGSKTVKLAASA